MIISTSQSPFRHCRLSPDNMVVCIVKCLRFLCCYLSNILFLLSPHIYLFSCCICGLLTATCFCINNQVVIVHFVQFVRRSNRGNVCNDPKDGRNIQNDRVTVWNNIRNFQNDPKDRTLVQRLQLRV